MHLVAVLKPLLKSNNYLLNEIINYAHTFALNVGYERFRMASGIDTLCLEFYSDPYHSDCTLCPCP
jgi:hypothetical protein